jgi:4-amino-4-deoxy-L-arabinose transferase-like glycosyltransferase
MKLSSFVFGTDEWALRLPNLMAFGVFAFFLNRLTRSMGKAVVPVLFVLLMANANVNAPDGTGMRLVCTGMCCMSQLELHFEGS